MTGTPFRNSILAGEELVRSGMRSENYEAGVAGWRVDRNGDAELNEGTFRGIVYAAGLIATGKAVSLAAITWTATLGAVTFTDALGPAVAFTTTATPWKVESSKVAVDQSLYELVGAIEGGHANANPDGTLTARWYTAAGAFISASVIPHQGIQSAFAESEGTFLQPPSNATQASFALESGGLDDWTLDLGTLSLLPIVEGGIFRTDPAGARGLIIADDRVNGQIRFRGDGGGTEGGIKLSEEGDTSMGVNSRKGKLLIHPPMTDGQTTRAALELRTNTDPAFSPADPSTGLLTASEVYIGSSTNRLYPAVAMRARRTGNQSIPHITTTTVVFATQDTDTDGAYDPATGIFTVPIAGWYSISSTIRWAPNAVGVRQVVIRYEVAGVADAIAVQKAMAVTDGTQSFQNIAHVELLGAGKTISIDVHQTSGAALNLEGNSQMRFDIVRIGA